MLVLCAREGAEDLEHTLAIQVGKDTAEDEVELTRRQEAIVVLVEHAEFAREFTKLGLLCDSSDELLLADGQEFTTVWKAAQGALLLLILLALLEVDFAVKAVDLARGGHLEEPRQAQASLVSLVLQVERLHQYFFFLSAHLQTNTFADAPEYALLNCCLSSSRSHFTEERAPQLFAKSTLPLRKDHDSSVAKDLRVEVTVAAHSFGGLPAIFETACDYFLARQVLAEVEKLYWRYLATHCSMEVFIGYLAVPVQVELVEEFLELLLCHVKAPILQVTAKLILANCSRFACAWLESIAIYLY